MLTHYQQFIINNPRRETISAIIETYSGSHLKTLVGILLSLSSDPHPVLHFWALYALAQVIESAGLMFF